MKKACGGYTFFGLVVDGSTAALVGQLAWGKADADPKAG